jgi:hypothetical protein
LLFAFLFWFSRFIQPSTNELEEDSAGADTQLDEPSSSSIKQTKRNLSALAEDEDSLTRGEMAAEIRHQENAAQVKRRADITKLQSDIQSTQKSSTSAIKSHEIETIYESTTESSIVEEKIKEKKLFENLVREKERYAEEESAKRTSAATTKSTAGSVMRSESSEKLSDLKLEENIEATLDFLSCFSTKSGEQETASVDHQKPHQQSQSSKSANFTSELKPADVHTAKQQLSESTDNLVEQLIDDLVADENEQYVYNKQHDEKQSHKSRAADATSTDTGSTVIDNDSSTSRNSILGNK